MYSACPAYCIMYCPAFTRMRNYLYTYLVLDYSYLSLKMSSPSGSISPTPRDTSADLVALNERLSTLEQALAAAQQTHQPHHRESYIYCPPCPALTHIAYISLQPTITTYKILPRSGPILYTALL